MSNRYLDIACIAETAAAVDIACTAVADTGTVAAIFLIQDPHDSKECHHTDKPVLVAEYSLVDPLPSTLPHRNILPPPLQLQYVVAVVVVDVAHRLHLEIAVPVVEVEVVSLIWADGLELHVTICCHCLSFQFVMVLMKMILL